jgi:hypothetical protein
MRPYEAAVTAFCHGWRKQDAGAMWDAAQKTWKYNNSRRDLRMFQNTPLMSFKLLEPTEVSEVMVDVPVEVVLRVGQKPRKETRVMRVIAEKAPFKPNVDGDWGVNPVSALRQSDG